MYFKSLIQKLKGIDVLNFIRNLRDSIYPPPYSKFDIMLFEKYGQTFNNCVKKIVENSKLSKVSSDFNITVDGSMFVIKIKDNFIANFRIYQLPGCCGVCVFHNLYVNQNFQNMGIGRYVVKIAIEIAKINNYTVFMMTDVEHNTPMSKISETLGFTRVLQFTNKKTDNVVNIHTLNI